MELRTLCLAIVFISPVYAAVLNSDLCPENDEVVLTYGNLYSFISTNYPGNYNSNSSCNWRFTGPNGSRILVTFIDFKTETCCDKLKIGNGHDPSVKTSLIFSVAGQVTANRAFASTGSKMWMNFTSDGENNDKGYSLEVVAYPAEEIVSCPDGIGAVHEDNICYCDTPPENANCVCGEDEFQCYNGRCIPQTSVCNGYKDCAQAQAEDEINCHSDCPNDTSGYLNYGERRVISSANYPDKYSNGLHCRWLFSGPDGALIVIKFDNSALDRTDYLFIGNGANPGEKNSTIRAFSGDIRAGTQYASSGSEMWVTFHTDSSFAATGFQLSVKAERADEVYACFNGSGVVTLENICDLEVNCETGADEFLCDCEAGQFQCYNRRCIDGAKQCNNQRDCNEGEDEINCHQKCPQDTDAFFVDYGSPQRISSADYPDEYPPNLHCRWLFESPEGSILVVKVVEFNVDDSGSDKLTLGSGSQASNTSTVNAELTGQVKPGIQYATSSNDAWITFVTDRTRSAPGWTLELSAAREDEVYVCFQGSGVVTIDNICDFEVNCETEYDELLCDCSVDDFKCYNERCIQTDKKCNGEIDCNQGEDEINCHRSCPTSGDPRSLSMGIL
ncbi:low-density lipoprotein receptor-related protein 12-like [Amphiura filiformis]|uniref:low-density lipoprotein receptor-related protein 12-like n=1 Tax=Amphiura filiformis TaxID=82378 RepID=UPI003B213F53